MGRENSTGGDGFGGNDNGGEMGMEKVQAVVVELVVARNEGKGVCGDGC